jgi:hypothetical protein
MSKWKHFIAAVLLGATTQAWAAPILSVNTGPAVQVGTTVTYNIEIADIADLFGYEFSINYDANYLRALSAAEGGFLATAGSTYGDVGTIDQASGTISYFFNSLIGFVPGASGSGLLATISFETIGVGTSAVSIVDTLFLNSDLNDIVVQAQSGTSVVLAEPGGPVDVPEPASALLFGAGLAGAAALRRRRTGARA